NTPGFVITDDDKLFNNPVDGPIDTDRDKDIPVKYEEYKILHRCKFRQKNKIGYNDVERLSSVVETYHDDHLGAIVSNQGYSTNSKSVAPQMKIMLCHTTNFIKKIIDKVRYLRQKANEGDEEEGQVVRVEVSNE
ncbi:15711_t:CDS:1, partial [Racocetra persica]